MKTTKQLIAAALVLATIGQAQAQGDAWSSNRPLTTRAGVGQAQNVLTGTVVAARRVTIQSDSGGYVGTGAGAAVGAAIGSNVGGGRGQLLGAILGVMAGGAAGNAVERRVNQADGVELVVRLDDGRMMSLTQDMDYAYAPGLKVYVMANGRSVHVSPM